MRKTWFSLLLNRLWRYRSVVILNTLLFAAGLVLSWADHFLTETQIRNRGYMKGTPFIWHWGVMGDGLLMPLVLVTIAAYWRRWKPWSVNLSVAVGAIFSALLHFSYALSSRAMPNCIAHEGHLTPMGWVHGVYMWLVASAFLVFYVPNSGRVERRDTRLVSWLFALHMGLGIIEPAIYAGDIWTAPAVWPSAITMWLVIYYFHRRLRRLASK
jgi:hypothetical protein